MLLLVWFSIENISLLLSAEKPQVPATVNISLAKLYKLPDRWDEQLMQLGIAVE